jgi:hypothetical protein
MGSIPNVWFPVSGTDTYTTNVPVFGTTYDNKVALVKFANTNTTTATININSIGAVPLRMWDGSAWQVLSAGDIDTALVYRIMYENGSDYFQLEPVGTGGGSQDLQSVLEAGSSASSITTDITVEGLENITIRTDGTGKTIDILNLDGPFLRLTSDFIISSGGVLYPWPGAAPAANGYVLKAQTDGTLSWAAQEPKVIQIAASDETTALTTGTAKITFRMPYAMTLTAVRASLSTTQTSGSILTVDINEGGSTILSTKLTIDNGEKTSTTAVTPPVISDTALADDAEITIDIDQVGDGTAKGLKVTLIGA